MGMMINRRRVMGKKEDIDPTGGYIIFRFAITEPLSANITSDNVNDFAAVYVDGIAQTISVNKIYDFSVGEHEVKWKIKGTVVYQNSIPPIKIGGSRIFTKAVVLLPSKLTEIKNFAMRGTPAYMPNAVYSYAKEPPVVYGSGISLWYLDNIRPLYVPKGSGGAYKAAFGWEKYKNAIREMS